MAIYHFHMQVISRSAGRSAVAAAAYRRAEKMEDERTGEDHDFTHKKGVEFKQMFAPAGNEEFIADSQKFWNYVESIEKKTNATVAKEFDVALPLNLSKEQHVAMLKEFGQQTADKYGIVLDIAYHADIGNPHAHGMFNERIAKNNTLSKTKDRGWNTACGGRERVEEMRREWADLTNRHLMQAGLDERVDHRSYKEQGIVQQPTIHMGYTAAAMEQQGIQTERGDINRTIKQTNRLAALQARYRSIVAAIAALKQPKPQPDFMQRIKQAANNAYNGLRSFLGQYEWNPLADKHGPQKHFKRAPALKAKTTKQDVSQQTAKAAPKRDFKAMDINDTTPIGVLNNLLREAEQAMADASPAERQKIQKQMERYRDAYDRRTGKTMTKEQRDKAIMTSRYVIKSTRDMRLLTPVQVYQNVMRDVRQNSSLSGIKQEIETARRLHDLGMQPDTIKGAIKQASPYYGPNMNVDRIVSDGMAKSMLEDQLEQGYSLSPETKMQAEQIGISKNKIEPPKSLTPVPAPSAPVSGRK